MTAHFMRRQFWELLLLRAFSTQITFMLWFVFAVSVGVSTPCEAMETVFLKRDVELRHATVRLSDLFEGVPAGIDRDIAQAPAPCQSALYDQLVLGRLAKAYRLDWQVKAGEADRVTVTTSCVKISDGAIRQAVISKIKDSGARGNVDIAFDKNNVDIALPAEQSTSFAFANFLYDPVSKRFSGEIVPDGVSSNFRSASERHSVSGRVTLRQFVPVVSRRLESGTILTAKDLDFMEIPDERLSGNTLTEAAQIVGQELKRSLPAGEMLRENDVMAPRLVQKGMLLTMKFETPMLQLTAQGRALVDGAKGDVVRVVNTQTNRMVEGVVEGPGLVAVQVQAAQKMAAAKAP